MNEEQFSPLKLIYDRPQVKQRSITSSLQRQFLGTQDPTMTQRMAGYTDAASYLPFSTAMTAFIKPKKKRK